MPPAVAAASIRLRTLPSSLQPLLFRGLLFRGLLSSTQRCRSSSHASSVDSSEVNHFNALASSWWDPHGPSRLLHLMNPLRHAFIASCLSSQSDPRDSRRKLHYLDVGCGGGIFAESAARLPHTASVTGIDPSADVLAIAKAHARRDPALRDQVIRKDQTDHPRLRYLNIGIEELPLPEAGADGLSAMAEEAAAVAAPEPDGYDILTLFEVLEHVSNPSAFLSMLLPHVRPGGWIVLSTIARTWTSWLTTKVMAEEILRIVPSGTHDWHKYVNEEEIRRWFEQQAPSTAGKWTSPRAMGVIYVPGVGWREVRGAEAWGNYFFAVRKAVS